MNWLAPFCNRSALAALALFLPAAVGAAEPGPDAAGLEFFEKKVRPVLVEHCFRCHSAEAQGRKKLKGSLFLDSREGLIKGGDSGTAVVPGEPQKSRLIEAVHYKNVDLLMPPNAKLPEAPIADLTTWVKAGAPWPSTGPVGKPVEVNVFDLVRRKREHWAWKPIRPEQPPAVADCKWPASPIDNFILARLEATRLKPSPAADRRTLLRRAYFDLTGLPPTPEQVEAFVKDERPDALARVVDVLLDSPAFGERWGRHWLDLVRYGESRGHEFDYVNPNAYQYRDYVIRALNGDVPYNQLVTEHVAGDLLPRPRLNPKDGSNESILGTGFWFLGEEVHSPVDVRQDQADRFDNRIDVLSKAFLGLTVACARCHDHKFDAISTKDYYSMFGFLESASYRLVRFDGWEQNRHVASELRKLRERERPVVEKAMAEALRPTVGQAAAYLLATRAALPAWPGKITPDYRRRLSEIAVEHKLDADRLGRWVTWIADARKDPSDPLHAWATVCMDAGALEPRRAGEVVQALADANRTRRAQAEAALKDAKVVVDYRQPRKGDWLPDDVTFGPGPIRSGDLRLDRNAVRLVEMGAAENDRAWDRLSMAPGSQLDPGALGGMARAGRTIRTPTVTLETGRLFYLVRGTGRAYVAAGHHVMIDGPLHRQLVQSIKTGDKFQWVAHDLTRYQGQHVHVEFTAAEGSDFAVAMVVQEANAPGPIDRPNAAITALLADNDSRTPEGLARGYQKLFTATVDRLAADRIVGSDDATDQARLVNALLAHPEVAPGNAAATAVRAEEARLMAQARMDSRLALAILDGNGVDERVFIRGSAKVLGPVVPRRFLEALSGTDPIRGPGSSRLELARTMTDPAVDPFISRVAVNRAWHHLFGRGIVPSVDNFGVLGEAPTHPELLDFLADRFVKDGWSTKKLIRTLMLTRTYQQSSKPQSGSPDPALVDPNNELLSHARLRRLEGEAIRDAILAISGSLNDRPFGPSVPVYLTEFQDGRGRPGSGPLDGEGRRSIYLSVRRNFLSALLLAFDMPIPFSTVGRRSVSNVPAQALILMNDPFVHQQAERWAKRMLARPGSAAERIDRMYLNAFGRPPTDDERTRCLGFVEAQAKLNGGGGDNPATWTDLAHVLFNVKEFIFLN